MAEQDNKGEWRDFWGLLRCPQCNGNLVQDSNGVHCSVCQTHFPIDHNAIVFSQPPHAINPSEKRERGAGKDTHWRQANNHFLQTHLQQLPENALILDVGAGRGDFLPYYQHFPHILLDIYPYPEIDIVCDLITVNPFQADCLDVVLLFNVLEHVQSPAALLTSLWNVLKPGGKIFITIPFMLKVHQAPLDFQRLTHYALDELAHQTGFNIITIEGVYDPVGLIYEATRYYRFWTRPEQKRLTRLFSGVILKTLSWHIGLLNLFSPKPYIQSPFETNNPAPLGYQLILEKPSV